MVANWLRISFGTSAEHQIEGDPMLKVHGPTLATDTHVDASFRSPATWPGAFAGMSFTAITLGHETCGPTISLMLMAPSTPAPLGPAHAHGADNFRVSLLGQFEMGTRSYGPGEFRFQQGFRPYPGDNSSHGPDGGWEIILMADQRGTRARYVGREDGTLDGANAYVANALELGGDLLDPNDTCDPSALSITLGPADNAGKLNGSFADSRKWNALGKHRRVIVSLMGHRTVGPVLMLSIVSPRQIAMPACRFDTEVFRAVIGGNCEIEGRRYNPGDIRVQRAETWCGPVLAGPSGLQEMLVIGDRQQARPWSQDKEWSSGLAEFTSMLSEKLSSRALGASELAQS